MATYTHIFNKGNGVLFWEKTDYIRFINRFATFALAQGVSTLSLTVMSTHFHAIVESRGDTEIENLLSAIKKSYSTYYGLKYDFSIGRTLEISKVPVSVESLMNEITYVMKNPVHHYVCESPFVYPFSNCAYIFPEMMYIPEHWRVITEKNIPVSSLSKRKVRDLFGESADYKQTWRVNEDGMLLPDSWMNLSKTRAVWNNSFTRFLVSMNSRTMSSAKAVINSDVLSLRGEQKSDLEVCSMILDYIREQGFKSVHQLSEEKKQILSKSLMMRGVNQDQCSRCLWLNI